MVNVKRLSFYKIKSDPRAPNAKKVLKFDTDLDLQGEYLLSYLQGSNRGYYDCNCPAAKFDCRHKSILAKFEQAGEIDGMKFFCHDIDKWYTQEEMEKL